MIHKAYKPEANFKVPEVTLKESGAVGKAIRSLSYLPWKRDEYLNEGEK